MLLLQGLVSKVTIGGKSTIDRETGETRKTDPAAFVLHSQFDDPDADLKLEKIKLKDNAQAEAFRKALGKNISVPVNVWHGDSSGGFWLSKGVLPLVLPEISR